MTFKSALIRLFYFFSLLPFISPIPINSDVQPPAIILGLILLIINIKNLETKDYLLLIIAIGSIFYKNTDINLFQLKSKEISIFCGLVLFLNYKNFLYENYLIFKVVTITYFLWAFALLILPEITIPIQKLIVRNINIEELDPFVYRGVPPLGTEPGLVGGLLVFLLIHADTYIKYKSINFYKLLILLTVLLTKSGIGYVYLLIYGFFMLYKYNKKWLFFIIITGTTTYYAIIRDLTSIIHIDNRGLDIIARWLNGEDVLTDQSILKRAMDFIIGFYTLIYEPLGVGVNHANELINTVAINNGLLRDIDIGNEISSVSSLTYYLASFGLIGISILTYVYIMISKAPFINRLFSFIFISISYSFAFPPTWLMLASKKKIK